MIYLLLIFCLNTQAGQLERRRAWILHNRIAGVPPSNQVLNQMEKNIINGDTESAIEEAMKHPNFLNIVMKNWFKPWSNQIQSTAVPLNDFVATAVGMIRDNIPFDEILYGDILYHANNSNLTNVTPYAVDDNKHYTELEANQEKWASSIQRVSQSSMNGITDTAGAITTRAFGEAYFEAGTNRRMTRFLFINFLCHDFEQLHDITIPDIRVRRDVERNPGDDSRIYKNKCVGCHAGQDALGGAWAFFNFTKDKVVHTPGQVQNKMNQNAQNYPEGFITMNDSWMNLWHEGQNAVLGWDKNLSQTGNGARQLGRNIAKSRAFSECMVSRSWELLCMRKIKTEELDLKKELTDDFMGPQKYNMKLLFTSTLNKCVNDEN